MTIATGKTTDAGLTVLRDKVKKLNKRAVRLGLAEMTLTVVRTETVKRSTLSGLDCSVRINHVEVDGCPPCIDGWVVAARIEFTEAGNLVHVAPNAGSIDHAWKTAPNRCDHCNTIRRRNDVIVIRNVDGRELCVGRNCLADYIRSKDAEAMIEYADWLGNVERFISDADDDYRGERVVFGESIETVLSAASICIRKLGWVSGREAYNGQKGSTKNDVSALLFAPPAGSRAYRDWERWIEDCDLTVCDHDIDLAAKALAWAKSLDPKESEYLHNLKVLAQSEWIGADKFGYVVSMIPAYNKEVERETERAARAARAAAKGEKGYIGEPKKRIKGIEATCVGVRSYEGSYGVGTCIRFEHRIDDASYAVLTWFATGDKTEDYEVGEDYTFDATCKKHEDNPKYGKATLINRVTVKS